MEGGSLLSWPSYWCRARPSCFMLFVHWALRADSRAACTAGKSRPIRTAMIAITTKSSMSVKPRLRIVQLLAHLEIALIEFVHVVADSGVNTGYANPKGATMRIR